MFGSNEIRQAEDPELSVDNMVQIYDLKSEEWELVDVDFKVNFYFIACGFQKYLTLMSFSFFVLLKNNSR